MPRKFTRKVRPVILRGGLGALLFIRSWIRGLALICVLSVAFLTACGTSSNTQISEKKSTTQTVLTPERVEAEAKQAIASAETSHHAKQYTDAEMLYRKALELQSNNKEARLGLAEVFLATNRSSKAAAVFAGLISDEKLSAQALQGNGLSYLTLRDLDRAKTQLLKAVELNDKLWRSWNGLGIIYDAQSDFLNAQKAYRTALKIAPKSGLINNNLGMSYMAQSKYSDAESQFVKALRKSPFLYVAETNLRFSLAWQGKYLDALSGLKENQWPEALNNIGFIAFMREDYLQAEAYLTRSIALSPSFYVVAHRNLKTLKYKLTNFAPLEADGTNLIQKR